MATRSGLAGLLAVAAVGLTLLAAPARADVIDGDWCAADGRTFSIRGPAITTPGGNETQGNYSRHHFSYVVPDGEANAGETVAMLLLNENTVNVQEGTAQAEIWLRCKPAIS
jgi:hypothetical protein